MRLRIHITNPDSHQMQVSLSGEVDLDTVPQLKPALERLAQSKADQIVLDLTELTYLGSVGVSLIIKTWDELSACEKQLVITGAHGPVKLVLEMLGLSHLVRQPHVRKRSASNGGADRTRD